MTNTKAPKRMKASEVYRKAARRISDYRNSLSCIAILEADQHERGLRERYSSLFSPHSFSTASTAWGYEWGAGRRQCRILALCFMAALTEYEEKHK